MPKAKSKVTKPVLQTELVLEERTYIPLTPEERVKYRAILETDLFRKVWSNIQTKRPSAFPGGGFNHPLGVQAASNKLHEIRGWQLFEAALRSETSAPRAAPKPLQETYPNPL